MQMPTLDDIREAVEWLAADLEMDEHGGVERVRAYLDAMVQACHVPAVAPFTKGAN